ncbi:MAG TPA: TetR/AcrR family transcriptional regulator [Polaromonas sp.]|uniref:TetR/AcrR family transcriptional regulator n=1 Tax=Polaromonas sp. TaxID=1869339 RepID=UPI002D250A3E|nr:TetR/AcrR family transcriptional regulator [Polaromonas sp.]HYW55458.1 TetR/AcrR family transcriptional regulator [Polaromonas sp.]
MTKKSVVDVAVEERGALSVRERVLETAATLFYQEGVRAVGVDLVVERSGVAKTSLYRHFATKDDLVVAFLEREDAEYWRDWETVAAKAKGDARAELEAHFRWIANHIAGPTYRGCAFLNVATEFPAPDHPARAVAARNKIELQRRLSALVKAMAIRKPDQLADQLVLLIDGAYVNGQLLGKKGPVHSLVAAGLALIAAAQER